MMIKKKEKKITWYLYSIPFLIKSATYVFYAWEQVCICYIQMQRIYKVK